MGWSIDDKYLMQSTGLKDRNDIEIYESDVVSWIDIYGILHFGVVEFTKGMFLVNGDEPVSEAMEVIGNIYEHPDLVGD
ncbi:YopX family protein [Streptococcus pluranimalium]